MDAKTIQILLDLLNPLHASLDQQITEQFTDESELDPPKDREYTVNVTSQNEINLTKAVLILEQARTAIAKATGQTNDAVATKKIVTEKTQAITESMRWSAHYDGQEEEGPYGYGPTEELAIVSLKEHREEDES